MNPPKNRREKERERTQLLTSKTILLPSLRHMLFTTLEAEKTIYKPPPLPIVSQAAQNLDAKKRSSHTNTQH
jgi:hypothetical protein